MGITLKVDPKSSNQGASGDIALIIYKASSEELEVPDGLAGCRLGALYSDYRGNLPLRKWPEAKCLLFFLKILVLRTQNSICLCFSPLIPSLFLSVS